MLHLTACACIPLCHLTKTACSFLKSVFLCLELTSNQRGCTYFVGSSRFEQPSWPEPLPLPELWDPHEPPPLSGVSASPSVKCLVAWRQLWSGRGVLTAGEISSSATAMEKTGVKCRWHTPLGLFAVGLKVRQVAAVYSAVSVGPHSLCEVN